MKRYEQMSFHEIKATENLNESSEPCLDCNGNLIHIGDYVIAVRGEPLIKNHQGIVKDINQYEASGTYMRIVTLSGRVLDCYANPLFFAVVYE